VIKLKNILNEGIEFSAITTGPVQVKFNRQAKAADMIPHALYHSSKHYAEVPAKTFLIGLPGGLFAVNIKKKFAFALTSGSRTWLDSQDKLSGKVKGIPASQAPQYAEWKHLVKKR
tara:strand:- start:1152 stop:1499 length:348 start_codon:yes stop_codon:yes gene_type:complete